MDQKVRKYVQDQHMIEKTDRVLAGVSGGADSICLLFVLLELQKELGFELRAVHVNHQIRGKDADSDQEYVETVCKEQGIDLVVYKEDVPKYAEKHKLTEEEAGREVRRFAFLRQMELWGGTKIALAHHRNDNVETLIFHLCRGTGLAGLAGIAPADGPWIHPLLCVDRKEIESYLEKRGISYCTDETNLDIRYTRNRIRQKILPYLEQYINRESVQHMARTMEEMTRGESICGKRSGTICRGMRVGSLRRCDAERRGLQASAGGVEKLCTSACIMPDSGKEERSSGCAYRGAGRIV